MKKVMNVLKSRLFVAILIAVQLAILVFGIAFLMFTTSISMP